MLVESADYWAKSLLTTEARRAQSICVIHLSRYVGFHMPNSDGLVRLISGSSSFISVYSVSLWFEID